MNGKLEYRLIDGAAYMRPVRRSDGKGLREPLPHMGWIQYIECALGGDLRDAVKRATACCVRIHCPCNRSVAEVNRTPDRRYVGISYEVGPEPLVRAGVERLIGSQRAGKAPARRLGLCWALEDIPDPWLLRCDKCRHRLAVAAHRVQRAAEQVADETIHLNARRR